MNELNNKFRSLFLNISESKYRKLPNLSYSALSSFDQDGPTSLVKKKVEDNNAFAFGSLVDELLLEQDNNFEDKFYMFNGKAPTASTLELANALLKLDNQVGPDNIEIVLEVIKTLNLWSKSKNIEVLIKKFNNDNFWGYIKAKQEEANGKYLIDTAMWARGSKKVNILKDHKYTKEYFTTPNEGDSFTQLKGVVKLYGVDIKFMLDLVKINHKLKIIYPIDLKTSSSKGEDFQGSFYKYRYWIQGGLYRKAIVELIKNTVFSEYSVAPFEFVVINSWKEDVPIKYQMPIELESKFSNEWVDIYGNLRSGYPQLIENLLWHITNREYIFSRKVIENNGLKILT